MSGLRSNCFYNSQAFNPSAFVEADVTLKVRFQQADYPTIFQDDFMEPNNAWLFTF